MKHDDIYEKASNKWYTYYGLGVTNILELRLKEVLGVNYSDNIEILNLAGALTENDKRSEIVLNRLIDGINDSAKRTVLAPINLNNRHWVGLMSLRAAGGIYLYYVDSERLRIPTMIEETLSSRVKNFGSLTELTVQQQKYKNCGLEVIENMVLYITGERHAQDVALTQHSRLVEDSLISRPLSIDFVSRDHINTKAAIDMVSGNGAVISDALVTYTGVVHNTREVSSSLLSSLLDLKNSQTVKSFVYSKELSKFDDVLKKHSINQNRNIFFDQDEFKQFKKSFSLANHPDKGGDTAVYTEVMDAANDLNKKMSSDIDTLTIFNKGIHDLGIAFKYLDVGTDAVRMALFPTYTNVKNLAVSGGNLYGMLNGVNGISTTISGFEIASSIFEEDYSGAIIKAASSAAYMSLPYIANTLLASHPAVLLTFEAGFALYSSYNAVVNTYNLYNEIITNDTILNDMAETCVTVHNEALECYDNTQECYNNVQNFLAEMLA